jgi:lactate dehydrogenase-like 2-hydroxyacid dehydrogenase
LPALGFDMDVLYYNRSRKPDAEKELGVTYADLDTLLKTSDLQCADERFLINRLSPGNIDETCRIFHQFKFPLSHHMVLYYNRSRKPDAEKELGVTYADLDTLLKTSDFVPSCNARMSAFSSTVFPREILTKHAVSFINLNSRSVL